MVYDQEADVLYVTKGTPKHTDYCSVNVILIGYIPRRGEVPSPDTETYPLHFRCDRLLR